MSPVSNFMEINQVEAGHRKQRDMAKLIRAFRKHSERA